MPITGNTKLMVVREAWFINCWLIRVRKAITIVP